MNVLETTLNPAASNFVYLRTYARWLESEGRREGSWEETADRYFDFMEDMYGHKVPAKVWKDTKKQVKTFGAMPSMRAAWSAGPSLERNHIAGYNCSFLPFSDLRAVAELFYILMNGTGVGFSVEREFIDKMPTVQKQSSDGVGVHVVGDSKEGWAEALLAGLECWFSGKDIEYDFSKVRPRGARLMTFGGRASGPGPLKKLLEFVRGIILQAQGRQLTSLEWLDIGNYCGEVVVVGGVRRSSEINFSDLDDGAIRGAKTGVFPPHRFMSNNSAVFKSDITSTQFMREWMTLAESGSGERGIYNLDGVKKHFEHHATRRGFVPELRTNPCVTGDTWVQTSNGPRQVTDLLDKPFVAMLHGKGYAATNFWSNGVKPVFKVDTHQGYSIKATSDHKLLTTDGWKRVQDLCSGDSLVLSENTGTTWEGWGPKDLGWVLGEIVGDGGFNPTKYDTYMRFWGDSATEMKEKAVEIVKDYFDTRSDFTGSGNGDIQTVKAASLNEFASAFLVPKTKEFLPALEATTSSDFLCGFVSGFFDADGTVLINHVKGHSVRLSQSDLTKLHAVQRILARLGIKSTVYQERRPEENRLLPDGKGGNKECLCRAQHELVISNDSVEKFMNVIGFSEPSKAAALRLIVDGRKRKPNKTTYTATVQSVTPAGEEEVFDCTVENVHAYDGNGIVTHNCGEIILRPFQFCVSGETPLITKDGIIPQIKDAVGTSVEVWNGTEWSIVKPVLTRKGADLVRVEFSDGSYLDCTPDHRFSVKTRFQNSYKEVLAKDLLDSKYVYQIEPSQVISEGGTEYENAYTLGFAVGDGHVYKGRSLVALYGDDKAACPVVGTRYKPQITRTGMPCTTVSLKGVVDPEYLSSLKTSVDAIDSLFGWSRKSVLEFFAGLADSDGSQTGTGGIRIYVSVKERALRLQMLLTKCGIRSSICLMQAKGSKTNLSVRQKDLYYLQITDCSDIPCHRLDTSSGHKPRFKGKYQSVRSVTPLEGKHDVYCFNEPKKHKAVFGNVLTHQCNLSEVVVRATDTFDDLIEKVKAAVWLGVMQAGLTDFKWIRPEFKKNCMEEALLGVSLTGQMDNVKELTAEKLAILKAFAIKTAKRAAKVIGINVSVAITTGKPSGTVSQLVQCGSGAHAWHDLHFIRRYRISATDPIFRMMRDQGFVFHPENGQGPEDIDQKRTKMAEEGWTEEQIDIMAPVWSEEQVNTWVVEFPMRAPEGALTRHDLDAIGQLEWYLKVMQNWCEHNQSITVYVKDHEWMKVGAWVYEHLDELIGVSFLPYDGGNYKQAPYETITEEEYGERVAAMKRIDWSQLPKYELEDVTTGAQALACSGNSCEMN